MLPNAPKIPSCNFIWKRRVSSGPSRLYLVTNFYKKSGLLKQRTIRFGNRCKYSTDPCNPCNPLPANLRAKGPCPEPQPSCEKPPPPKKKTTIGFGTTLAVLGVGTAAVVAYAKYDCEFREYIEKNAPLFNEFIKISTQEDHTYAESWRRLVRYVTEWFDFSSEVTVTPKKKKEIVCSAQTDPAHTAPKPALEPLLGTEEGKGKGKGICDMEPPVMYNEIRMVEPPSPAVPVPSPVIIEETARPAKVHINDNLSEFHPKNVVELEKHIGIVANDVYKSYSSATCAVRDHAKLIYEMLETHVENLDAAFWCNLKKKTEEKEEIIKKAEKTAKLACEKISKLQSILDDPAFGAPDSLKIQAKRNIAKILKDLEKSKADLEQERDRTSVAEQYWDKVEQARMYFKGELEILFPSLKLDEKKFDLKPNEFDLFLVHAHQNILYYQKEISKLETIGERRIKEILQKRGETLNQDLIDLRVHQELEKERRNHFKELHNKVLEVKAEQEKEIRLQLKRQVEAAEDYMKDMLEAKEQETARKTQRIIDEKVEVERNAYRTKLAEMIGRMQGVEAALSSRLASDKMATQAQVLFSSCQSFYRSLRAGVPGVHYSKGLKPLEAEINAIEEAAGEDDPLITAVLASVPDEAKTRGVYPEAALRERFLNVEKTARRLALIPEEGSSLPRFFISYLQSFLVFKSENPMPSAELEDQPVDTSKLDTYDILERARYWLDRGDFAMTLRYMNLLKGAPREVACEWMNETRIYLETQQAADTLMAYAAATGQQYL